MNLIRREIHLRRARALILSSGCLLIYACAPVPSENANQEQPKPNIHMIQPTNTSPEKKQTAALKNAHYVDDEFCADCHSEIFDSFQQVAMAKSFYDFDSQTTIEDFNDNEIYHAASDNHYRMEIVNGQFQLERFKRRADDSIYGRHKQVAHYVVGSGNHVRTYLYRNDVGEMFQLPVVWYSQNKKWGMAPGYDRPDHLDFHRPIIRDCLFCHNAYPEFDIGSDTFGQPHLFPEKLPQGIGCQRCHGPGSEHIRVSTELDSTKDQDLKQIQDSIVNTAKLDGPAQDDVCFQCHLQPMSQRTSFIRKFGQGDYGYMAGKPLNEFMLFFEPARDNHQADHFEINHHPYRLQQSKCYLETQGGIRCTTCHDPHQVVPELERPEYYRKKCYTCHQNDDCLDLAKGRQPDANCIQCHMVERRTTDVVNVTMTDHKIVRVPQKSNPTAPLQEIDVPIDMPIRPFSIPHSSVPDHVEKIYEFFARTRDDDESSFDRLRAEIDVHSKAMEPNLQLAQRLIQIKRYEQAEELLAHLDDQPRQNSGLQIGRALAILGQGDLNAGTNELQRLLQFDKENASAWHNLGVAYSKTDRQSEAISCYAKAIELRPNYIDPRLKLGSQLALDGQFEKAAELFAKVLTLDVRNLEAYQKLASTMRRRGQWNESVQTLKDALTIDTVNQRVIKDLILTLLDKDNDFARDPEWATELATKFSSMTQNSATATLMHGLAHIESNDPEIALSLVATVLGNEHHKPAAGLIVAMAQKQISSTTSAEQNYQGAREALRVDDRLSRIILQYADSMFAGTPSDQ